MPTPSRLPLLETQAHGTQGPPQGSDLSHVNALGMQHHVIQRQRMRLPDTTSSMTTRDHLHTASADRSRTMAMLTDQFAGSEIALGIQLKHIATRALANAATRGYAAGDT